MPKMVYQQEPPNIEINKFDGGLNVNDPEYQLTLDQSPDLDNLILNNNGFGQRNGDTAFNSSVMGSSTTPVTGLGYIKLNSGTEFLNAIAGAKFYTSSSLTGTMADATGAVTITSGARNIWTPINYNNLQIWFGGPASGPDAPFKYSGTGNAAALGGTPPSALTAFAANNRIFAIKTAANPSRVQWPVLSDPEDWTGAGSGSADVSKSDGDSLQCGVVTGTDTAILFKESSTHLMVLTKAPFPVYQLQRGRGVCGPRAFALANGVIYFMTPSRRILATSDGINFTPLPRNVDPILDTINTTYLANVEATYFEPLNWVIFTFATGSNTTNNYAIIWDVRYECFLRCTTGYKSNVLAIVANRVLYGGHYDGKVYKKNVANTFSDASETSPGTIDAYWRTPFKNLGDGMDKTVHPLYFSVAAATESSTVLELSYGFDFTSKQATQNSSIAATGGVWDTAEWDVDTWGGNASVMPRMFVYGRGNTFSLKIRNASAGTGFTCQGISIRLRTDKARKLLNVT